MILRFPVPSEPLSVNHRKAQPRSRGGAIALSRERQAWRDTCEAFAADHPAIKHAARTGKGLGPSTVEVTIPFANQRARDPHNYTGTVVKWVIDGLVRAGAWPDDTPDYVTVLDPRLVVGDEVVVAITPRTVRTDP